MKKFLKIVLILLGVLLLIGGGGVLFISLQGIPSYEANVPEYQVHPTPEKIERGKKLASMLCVHCHLNPETGALTGKEMKDAPEFGFLYSQNITQDKEHGIGNWTDGELLYLLRTGLMPNGRYTPPWMAKLPHMSDNDIEAVIAFLKSDDPLVTPKAVPDQKCEPSLLTKFLCRVAFKPLPMPEKTILPVDTTDKIALGRYYVYNLDCYTCHSASFETMNVMEPHKSEGFMGGGNPSLKDMDGHTVPSLNLTPHKTGIGDWTEEQFVRALKYGLKDGEPALRYPMVPFTQLTDYEASAIYAYLRTIPPIDNNIPRKAE